MISGEFSLVSLQASLADDALILTFSHDIDDKTATEDSVFIVDHDTRNVILTKNTVDGQTLTMHAVNGFVPNVQYTLLVQRTILNIVGAPLEDPILRNFTFKSEVTDVPETVSPANFEKIRNIKLSWKIKDKDGVEKNAVDNESFLLQIAKENAFYNIVYSTTVTGSKEIELSDKDIPAGQYYWRIRCSAGDSYGKWSNIATFLFNTSADDESGDSPKTETGNIQIIDMVDPKSSDDLIGKAEKLNYDSMPEYFAIKFDEEIDPSLDGIAFSVERRDI